MAREFIGNGKIYAVKIDAPHEWSICASPEEMVYADVFVDPYIKVKSDYQATLEFKAPASAMTVLASDKGAPRMPYPGIKKVIFNGPATIVFFNDGGKEVVKCDENDEYNQRVAVMAAMLKHSYGNKWIDDIDSIEKGDGQIKVEDLAPKNIGEAVECLVSSMVNTALADLADFASKLTINDKMD